MNTHANDLTPLPAVGRSGKQYFSYTCRLCGQKATNSYIEPTCDRMLETRSCFSCDHWGQIAEKYTPNKGTVIDGVLYSPGNRTSGSLRGMAGRRFDIEYVDPSPHAGKQITTFDLWCGGAIPEAFRAKLPDTARFLNGAERAQVGETMCWDHSSNRSEPFPLPSSIGIG